jgi:hypothetical protein
MQNNLGRLGGQLGVLLTLLGLLIIFFGWNGAASTDYVPAQFPYLISGGVVGIAVVVVGAAMILVQNFRTDMARLEAAVERVALAVERQHADAGASGAGIDSYVVAGSESYHRVECALPEARAEAHLVPLTDVAGSTLQACRVCQPPTFGRITNA